MLSATTFQGYKKCCMLAMDVWCFSKSTARIDLEKHQTRLHYWGISLCNFGESPLQFWVFLLYTKQQMAQVMCFLQENGLTSYDELSKRTDEMTARFNQLSEMIKTSEQRLAEIAVLRTHIINYSKTRNVYVEYRKAGYSRKFYETHREEIMLHKAAKEAFNQLNVKKIPRVKELNMEYAEVMKQKKAAYAEYRSVRKEMQDYVIARKTAATILEIDLEAEARKRQEQEKEKDTKRDTGR